MAITLHIEPRKEYTWDAFRQHFPPYSIALDGFVRDSTQRDPRGPYANFDHHVGCDRTSTRSTAAQVAMEINLGLFRTFRKEGIPTAQVCIDDPDEDTCLSYWELKNHELVEGHGNPTINRLIFCEDMLDATAGAYPLGDTAMRRTMAWIFQPYNDARFAGRIAQMDASGMRDIVEAVGSRITQYILGQAEQLPLEGHFESIGGGNGWSMTRETGPASRMAMYNSGICAFVTLVAEKPDGSRVFALGKKSLWVPTLDLPRIYARCNREESAIVTPDNRWNGSGTTGGSPKGTGSRLTPQQLQDIIQDEMSK